MESFDWTNLVFQIHSSVPDSSKEIYREALRSRGGRELSLIASEGISPDPLADRDFAVLVTETIDFPEWPDWEWDDRRWAVTPRWVENTERTNKWQNPAFYSADPTAIFSGVVVFADQLHKGDMANLAAMVKSGGGRLSAAITQETTHCLFALPEGENYSRAMGHRGKNLKVVMPNWLYDSITHNARLNTKNYEWPNPPICDPDERAIDAPEAAIAAHQKQLVRSVRAGDAAPQQPSGVLLGKRVLLGGDHGYNTMSPRYCAVKTLVERAGGVVESNDDGRGMHKADILITRFRAGEEYIIARRLNKMIGTISWLQYIIDKKQIISPKASLLHFPIPAKHIPEFENFVFTITNYTGTSRDYLKQLLDLLGARFSAELDKKKATHVIAAAEKGPKVSKARDWHLNIVNHQWLESCFINWRVVPISAEHCDFPPGVSFMELIGTQGITDAEIDRVARNEAEAEERAGREAKAKAAAEKKARITTTAAAADCDVEMAEPEGDEEKPVLAEKQGAIQLQHFAGDEFVSSTSTVVAPGTSKKRKSAPPPEVEDENGEEQGPQRAASKPRSSAMTTGLAQAISLSINGSNQHIPASVPTAVGLSSSTTHTGEGLSSFITSSTRIASPCPPIFTAVTDNSTPRRSVKSTAGPATNAKSARAGSAAAAAPSPSISHGLSPDAVLPGTSRRKAAAAATEKLHNVIMPDVLKHDKEKKSKRFLSGGGPAPRAFSLEVSDRGASPTAASEAKGKGKMKVEPEEEPEVRPSSAKTARGRVSKASAEPAAVRILTTGCILTEPEIRTMKEIGATFVTDPSDCTHLVAKSIMRTEKFLIALNHAPEIVSQSWIIACIKAKALIDHSPYPLKDRDGEKKYGISLAQVLARTRRLRAEGSAGILAGKQFYITRHVATTFETLQKIIEAAGGEATTNIPRVTHIQEKPDERFVISCSKDKGLWKKQLHDKGVRVFSRELILLGVLKQELDFEDNAWPWKRRAWQDEDE